MSERSTVLLNVAVIKTNEKITEDGESLFRRQCLCRRKNCILR